MLRDVVDSYLFRMHTFQVTSDCIIGPTGSSMNKHDCVIRLVQEKRIYDLKKKNQELEKFKFVLDYKIKELKKQIEPRENDIKAMKEQIQEVSKTMCPCFLSSAISVVICFLAIFHQVSPSQLSSASISLSIYCDL